MVGEPERLAAGHGLFCLLREWNRTPPSRLTHHERGAKHRRGRPARTRAGSLEGNPPWGPTTEQRFPIMDPERGIVLGITLLHYPTLPNQPKMYVSEIFKIVNGRITRIDNIGLVLQDINTLGFIH